MNRPREKNLFSRGFFCTKKHALLPGRLIPHKRSVFLSMNGSVLWGVLLAALLLWALWANKALALHQIPLASDHLPAAFAGLRIAHLSDLHNARFGRENRRLLDKLAQAQPDLIVLTGDLIDARRTNLDRALAFAVRAAGLAPTYYVPGNHEARLPAAQYQRLRQGLTAVGVTVLEHERVTLTRSGDRLTLLGLADQAFARTQGDHRPAAQLAAEALEALQTAEDGYTILLVHRPESFPVYAALGADLVLSGHTHGGQVRLPGLGGLFAPSQGFFPRYDAGLYRQGQASLVISRGLGNSLAPLRLNNRPEVVVLTLSPGPQ